MRLLIFVLLLAATSPASALDVAVPLEHDGRAGVWFVLTEARRLNALDVTAELRVHEVRLLERQLTLAIEVEIPALRQVIETTHEISTTWREAARDAHERLDSLWRQPILWLAIGLAAGAVVAGFLFSR